MYNEFMQNNEEARKLRDEILNEPFEDIRDKWFEKEEEEGVDANEWHKYSDTKPNDYEVYDFNNAASEAFSKLSMLLEFYTKRISDKVKEKSPGTENTILMKLGESLKELESAIMLLNSTTSGLDKVFYNARNLEVFGTEIKTDNMKMTDRERSFMENLQRANEIYEASKKVTPKLNLTSKQ